MKIDPGVIWYFEPHGKLNPGSIYIHGILNPPISNQKICSEVKISCVGGSIFYGQGGGSKYHG